MTDKNLEETLDFIHQHRSNEINFEKLDAKLEEQLSNAEANQPYAVSLAEIKEKQVVEYKKAKKSSGEAWPEFEKFVSHFERAITEAMKNNP
jgi:pyruvate/2-oxoglutarate dehydrogenase complex dihydrolipoamide acyltransferase (E2) component